MEWSMDAVINESATVRLGSPPPERAGATGPPNGRSVADECVLLVDDNPRNVKALSRFLSGRGFKLVSALSGEQAVEVARASRPAIILLDVMMPEMDGFETCRRLKEDPATRGASVIFLSGVGDTGHKVSGLGLGAVDYITKPIQAEEVVARVNTHLTIRRLNLQLQEKIAHIERELHVVQGMQRLLLPRELPQITTLELAASYTTSRYAGGDYYDVVPAGEGKWGILIADVSGHGTPAAVGMAMVRTAFHAFPQLRTDPPGMLRAINDHFEYWWNELGFVTALYGVYDAAARTLEMAIAGHHRPLAWRATTGRAEDVPCEGTVPLLVGPMPSIPTCRIELAAGDCVLFYTDGITDRTMPGGDFYGVERLLPAMERAASAGGGAGDIVQRIVDNVTTFAAGQEPPDDQTLLLGAVL